jgi:pyrroloquinoline-quinone synthase
LQPTPDKAAFEQRLRAIGAERYHDKHPFHRMLHGGECTMTQVRAWVINRYYYQSRIPMKDAAFMSRVEDPSLRRVWRRRIEDHDGGVEDGGGIRRWLKLAEAVGLDPDYVASTDGVLAGTRFAVDAYVSFVREKPMLEAVASSLTEMFAPAIHSDRMNEAPEEVAFGLSYVLDKADTLEKQDAAAAALTFKTDVLWSQLDALYSAYVAPGRIPPGAWNGTDALAAGVQSEDIIPAGASS